MTVRQAVVLAGGRGTRMSPLTRSVPKGLIPVVGIPFVDLQLRQLGSVGIEDILLAVGTTHLQAWEEFAAERSGVRLVVEQEPLDTAGPVRQAAALGLLDDEFMVLNGDVILEADLAEYLDRVRSEAEATLALVEVEDTSAYGVVVLDDGGMVKAFVEKPPIAEAPARTVNAGIYLVRRSALERYPEGPMSFEHVVFPDLVDKSALGGVVIEGRWMDIGTPELYLDTTGAILHGATGLHRPHGPHLIEGDVAGTVGGDWSWIATGAVVEEGAVVAESVVLPGARIGAGADVRRAIVGWDATIGSGTIVTGAAIVGKGARIGADTELDRGVRIAPDARLGPGDVTFSPPN